jgi:hypothetical protein
MVRCPSLDKQVSELGQHPLLVMRVPPRRPPRAVTISGMDAVIREHKRGRRRKGRLRSPDLDQLDGFAAGAFDHQRARVAKLVGLFEKGDALTPELVGPGIEIGDAQRDMVL